MSDNIPLFPEKSKAMCADVRTVLTETFRELDHLLPEIDGHGDARESRLETNLLIKNLSTDRKEIERQERDIQWQHAKRLARTPLSNIYTLHSPHSTRHVEVNQELGLLRRKDLKPPIEHNANCDKSLWVQNILNRSSGDLSLAKTTLPNNVNIQLPVAEAYSLQSISLGEIIPRTTPPPLKPEPPALPPAHIVCLPPQVAFVNFIVGQQYAQSIRLVNTSKKEISLSIRPLSHHSLKIELRTGLTVTSGAAAELNVHFSPTSVRTIEETLSVQVSVGRSFVIPVRCYIEPPVLEILIPNPSSDLHVSSTMENVEDVLDLGAKLLGDVHRSLLLLICKELHAYFFILSEESWQDCDIQIVRDLKNPTRFGISTDCFYLYPASWSASEESSCVCSQGATCYCGTGGGLQGEVSAYLTEACTKVAVFRIISSTALVRTLHVVADALMFNSEHITIKAQEKDFDICDESDPYCEYYLHLGTAFPYQTLSMYLQVLNHSPLTYKYCWRTRAWGEDLSTGQFINKLTYSQDDIPVWVRETDGVFTPRSSYLQNVEADVGCELGTQCAVVMLILEDIPWKSLPSDHDFLIVNSKNISEEAIPGVNKSWSREVCSVVYAQVEVRWEVVPVRFVLDPPFVRLSCSRSIKSLSIPLKITQLYGVQALETKFDSTDDLLLLDPKNTVNVIFTLPLKQVNEIQTDVITLTSIGGEWSSSCVIEYAYTKRRLSLHPAMTYLNTRSPDAAVCTKIDLHNNTYENLDWHAISYSSEPAPACSEFCATIARNLCRCPILKPLSGNITHEDNVLLQYNITTSEMEGCYATIIHVKTGDRPEANTAALISYRVMVPRIVFRIQPCLGDCSICAIDPGEIKGIYKGTAVLRPQSLRYGERLCCRLHVWNTTPIGTRVMWEESEDDDVAFVKFYPNEFQLEGYSEAHITVVLEARRVCNRQLIVRQALVAHSQPIYLLIDIAITGVEAIIEFPIGGEERTESFVTMKLIQKDDSTEAPPDDITASVNDIFAQEDYKRIIQKKNICDCKKKMVYIPPVKRPEPPRGPDDYPPVEIVYTPPLTRVCPCTYCKKPVLPEQTEPYCIQFKQVPKNTVRSRTVVLYDKGGIAARWRTAVRHWNENTSKESTDSHPTEAQIYAKLISENDGTALYYSKRDMGDKLLRIVTVPWSRRPGVSLQCTPATGTLKRDGVEKINISFHADTWGVYYDQILIQIEHLEPVVVDVWAEVIGPPLQFPLRPSDHDDMPPVLWMTSSDPEHVVRFTNTSRADLLIYPYISRDHEYLQDSLPFRLYVRLYDVLPPTCPCVTAFIEDSDAQSHHSDSLYEAMLTGIELYLAADYGIQDDSFYQIRPHEVSVKAKEKGEFNVKLLSMREQAPNTTLVLRILPTITAGKGWYRPIPQVQHIQVRAAQRSASVHASCTEVVAAVCALDIPRDDIMRLRKHFYLRNAGTLPAMTRLYIPQGAWLASLAPRVCDTHCTSTAVMATDVELLPGSSIEIFVEVRISAQEYWPEDNDTDYSTQSVHTSTLYLYDVDDILLLSMPLTLLIDQPRLYVEPDVLDLGIVSDGRTAKGYYSISHSSPTATIEIVATCNDEDFRLFPTSVALCPGETKCVYVQYTARWRPYISTVRTKIEVSYIGGARTWCRATLPLSVFVQRCSERRTKGDYTDDTHLVPDI